MTKSELVSLVAGETGRSDKAELIGTYLEMGLREIGLRHTFREMVHEEDLEFEAGDGSVQLPEGCHQVVEARVIDGTMSRKFELRRKKWVVELWPNVEALSRGRPWVGYIEGGKVMLYPVSNGSYKLRVTYVELPEFGGDDVECPIPVVENALVSLAKSKVWLGLEMYDKGAAERAVFERQLLDAIRADAMGPEEVGPLSVPDDTTGWWGETYIPPEKPGS